MEDPKQELHDESHARSDKFKVPLESGYDIHVQVKLSCGDTNVSLGHSVTHWPWERKKPGKHPVHCNSFAVEAALKLGMMHDVHFAGQPFIR